MRVFIVDDSIVFRSQLKRCLDGQSGVTVVGAASNGKIALQKMEQIGCDLVILDLEMPEMDGLDFLEAKARLGFDQAVIVFASSTKANSTKVMQALAAGASDVIAKPTEATSLEEALEAIRREFLPRILQFKDRRSIKKKVQARREDAAIQEIPRRTADTLRKLSLSSFRPHVVVVASSTGGPAALEVVLASLHNQPLEVPILVVQHMPPNFTAALATRLFGVSGWQTSEGRDGEEIIPGRIYVAPGDCHMVVARHPLSQRTILRLDRGAKRNSVRPAADILFESAAEVFGARTAALVLTGMGEDGKEGSIAIKKAMGAVMIQDRESSVVWGMPGSVHAAGAWDAAGDLRSCGDVLRQWVAHKRV